MAILPMNWKTVDKRLGCRIFYHGVVGFVFKFGSNWTNFDVSTPFLMQGWCSVRARKVSEMVSGPTSLSLTLLGLGLYLSLPATRSSKHSA